MQNYSITYSIYVSETLSFSASEACESEKKHPVSLTWHTYDKSLNRPTLTFAPECLKKVCWQLVVSGSVGPQANSMLFGGILYHDLLRCSKQSIWPFALALLVSLPIGE